MVLVVAQPRSLLTPQQERALRLALAGYTIPEIGAALGISSATAAHHLEAIRLRTGVRGRNWLVRIQAILRRQGIDVN